MDGTPFLDVPFVVVDVETTGTSPLHGDRVTVRRSAYTVRFLHPQGWNYYATLRRKLRWNEGVS